MRIQQGPVFHRSFFFLLLFWLISLSAFSEFARDPDDMAEILNAVWLGRNGNDCDDNYPGCGDGAVSFVE